MEDNSLNEDKKALAVKREEDGTLKVVAFGTGKDAEAIIEKATECEIEVVRDREKLKRVLEKQQEGEAVPDRVYGLISEIMCFVTDLDEAWMRKDFNGNAARGEEP